MHLLHGSLAEFAQGCRSAFLKPVNRIRPSRQVSGFIRYSSNPRILAPSGAPDFSGRVLRMLLEVFGDASKSPFKALAPARRLG
jgi:hypothetical protein